MKIATFHEVFAENLQDLYDAERQITQALPQMIEAASDPELKSTFGKHLTETQNQIIHLEQACKELGIDPQGKTCIGMEGLIEEGVELMQMMTPSPVLDAALIGIAQKIEHYEIAGYGTVAAYAELMGHMNAKKTLGEILQEEKTTDKKLSNLAESLINKEALQTVPGMKTL